MLLGSGPSIRNRSEDIQEFIRLYQPLVIECNVQKEIDTGAARQAGRERGRNIADVPYHRLAIREAIRVKIAAARPLPDTVYGEPGAGERIASVLSDWPMRIEKRLTF